MSKTKIQLKFDFFSFLNKLVALGERQLEGEIKARRIIEDTLNKFKIKYQIQNFSLFIPKALKETLLADGKKINGVRACCFKGGKIEGNYNLISSLISSQKNIDDSNLDFNPACEAASRSNHYFAPALAVPRQELMKVVLAKKVKGEVRLRKIKHQSANILVGNLKTPKNILFAHYDSIGPGAVDNASGVALLMKLSSEEKIDLTRDLIVFSGAEEISYDYPLYWGHGFRVFEARYGRLLNKAKKILAVDGIGYSPVVIERDKKFLTLCLPLKNIDKLINKIVGVNGVFNELMSVYHSALDDGKLVKIRPEYVAGAEKGLIKELK